MAHRILVTGSNGYIGCVLCTELVKRGYEVYGIDNRLFPKNFEVAGYPYEVEGVHYTVKDIRDINDSDFEGVDALVHLAGLSNDPMGDINDKVTRKINVYATVEMVSLAKKAGVKKTIFSSSCSVYGYNSLDSPLFFSELSPTNPVSVYAESKLVCEGALRQLNDSKFTVQILRNATVYGPSPRMRFDLLINAMVASSFFSNEIVFYSHPRVKRPLIHVLDLCNVLIHFLENNHPPDVFNVGQTVDNYSISDVAVLICQAFFEQFGKDINLRYKINNADPRSYLVDFSKLKKTSDNLFNHSVLTNIQEMIEHFSLNFKPGHSAYQDDTSFQSINHLISRVKSGELDSEFRVIRR